MSEAEIERDWPKNYFNYYTEIEECFQRARGTSLFLLSPLDWALIETWKNSDIPLEAVLRGVEAAFEKWRSSKRSKIRRINSLAYCAQAVLEQAQEMARGGEIRPAEVEAPFSAGEVEAWLRSNASQLRAAGRPVFAEVAASLERMAGDAQSLLAKLEEVEQRLTALEDKLLGVLRAEQSEEDLFQGRKELDSHLRPYRGKMTAAQLTMVEKQFLDRRLFEQAHVPRLSLFYM